MHRYGRHGQGAWLRQNRKRWQKRVSSSMIGENSAASFTVITAPFSVGVGRVIVIVMGQPRPDDFDETNPPELSPPIVDADEKPIHQEQNMLMAPRMKAITESAAYATRDITQRFSRLYPDTVMIPYKDNLKGLAIERGSRFLTNTGPEETKEEKDKLLEVYVEEFMRQFTPENTEGFACLFLSKAQLEMQKIVEEDRVKGKLHDQQDNHLRDVAVIQAPQALGIPYDQALDHLAEIHTWSDLYDDARQHPKKLEEWPKQPDFF